MASEMEELPKLSSLSVSLTNGQAVSIRRSEDGMYIIEAVGLTEAVLHRVRVEFVAYLAFDGHTTFARVLDLLSWALR